MTFSLLCRLNEIVAVGPETFYITNWVHFRNKHLAQVETVFLELHWSNLLLHHNGLATAVADGFLMANGVNVSPDGK